MSIIKRIKWVLGILLVFGIVLATNQIDKRHYEKIQHSTSEMYDDRLVAMDALYDMARLINEKEIALAAKDAAFFENRNPKVNAEIKERMALFNNNKFQYKENKALTQLKQKMEELEDAEQKNSSLSDLEERGYAAALKSIHDNLDELTVIHLNLGREKVLRGERAIETINMFSRIEIIFLIVLAILLQVMVLYRPKQ